MVMSGSENNLSESTDKVENGNEITGKKIYETPVLIKLDVLKDTYNAGPTFLDAGAFS